MKQQGFRWAWVLAAGVFALFSGEARAVPVLQLYIEGATYVGDENAPGGSADSWDTESWVLSPDSGDPIRLWVIGNVSGGGGMGTISDVKLSIVYEDQAANTPDDVTITLTPSTIDYSTGSPYEGWVDDSTPTSPGAPIQTVDDGSLPVLGDGVKTLPDHGVYGAGVEWQEFLLGDFDLEDSPIADFINGFPSSFSLEAGQINVYDLSVEGDVTSIHIDVYNHVVGGNDIKVKFAPFSHDGVSDIPDDPTFPGNETPVPEPGSALLFLVGFVSLTGLFFCPIRVRNRRQPA